MTLDTHIRDIWIAVGVLSALGIFLAFLRTTVWQSRTTKLTIELVVSKQISLFFFSFKSSSLRRFSNSSPICVISSRRYSSSLWRALPYGG